MLHINKLSVPQRTKPHPYMKLVYKFLDSKDASVFSSSEGTLVQSFRSIHDLKYRTPGWIWFNVSHLKPSMAIAELVLLRKTLHPQPLSVSIAVHSIFCNADHLTVSNPIEEKVLSLDEPPPSGFDVFNVSSALVHRVDDVVGFQFRYTDESGSLVLHEALTQSLYCLNSSSQNEPLLVVYQAQLGSAQGAPWVPDRLQRQRCNAARKRQLLQLLATQTYSPQHCRLHQRYIDFHSVSLDYWILQPPGFHATFCRGICHVPTSIQHAEENTKKRYKGNETASRWVVLKPVCIPQKLSSLTVMYRNDRGDVIIKILKDMKAENCVCQTNTHY
uniref:TGF-beta family profile domain-containing protein n=1 Tax=Lepisosteus oculatus TaxID=7918 RepID=W5MYW4_LEPOC